MLDIDNDCIPTCFMWNDHNNNGDDKQIVCLSLDWTPFVLFVGGTPPRPAWWCAFTFRENDLLRPEEEEAMWLDVVSPSGAAMRNRDVFITIASRLLSSIMWDTIGLGN